MPEWKLDDDFRALVDNCIAQGEVKEGRNGKTYSVFGRMLEHDMSSGFPLLTTRRIHTRGIFGELAAFIEGATSLARFKKLGCNYWDMNAGGKDDLGRIYGAQWREFRSRDGWTDQLVVLLQGLLDDPYSRRHILTTWHPAELGNMCLPPCHLLNQYRVTTRGTLDSLVYMRSVDLCLGLPSDLVLYGLLLHLICKDLEYLPGKLVFALGDAHVYQNHFELWHTQRERKPSLVHGHTPALALLPTATTLSFKPDQARVLLYLPHEAMRYELN